MKYLLLSFLIIFSIRVVQSQDIPIDTTYHEEESISIGYIYSGENKNGKIYHFLEMEYWDFSYSSKNRKYRGFNRYYGLDFGLNKDEFIAGPKVGSTRHIGNFIIGLEFILYTDFKEATLKYSPILGIGNHLFKLTMGYHFGAINKSFEPVGRGQVNIAFKLSKLKKRTLP